VAHEAGNLNDIRAVLGNDIAIKSYREGRQSGRIRSQAKKAQKSSIFAIRFVRIPPKTPLKMVAASGHCRMEQG
jgi:hypothetical protein